MAAAAAAAAAAAPPGLTTHWQQEEDEQTLTAEGSHAGVGAGAAAGMLMWELRLGITACAMTRAAADTSTPVHSVMDCIGISASSGK